MEWWTGIKWGKRRERKKRKVSLEDYCHTAVTVTVPRGQYGGGIGGGRMVEREGGGAVELHSPSFSLLLSLSYPPSSSQTPCFPWWLAHPVVNAKRPNLQLWGGGCRETDRPTESNNTQSRLRTNRHTHKVHIKSFLLFCFCFGMISTGPVLSVVLHHHRDCCCVV